MTTHIQSEQASSIQEPSNRRGFLRDSATATAATALVAGAMRTVHAADDETIQVALVGCGGRGSGAATNALSVPNEPMKLVAMADVFDNRLQSSFQGLSGQLGDKVDVPEDRRFIGFDAYKLAMDCLRPGDVVILTTPPAFRWVQFRYAIERGLNVFMEKPVTVDAPTSKRMLELSKLADAKNIKAAVGLMCRHCEARHELVKRIRDGEIGDVLMLRAYRMAGPTGSAATGPKPEGISELDYQIQRFHSFLWLSGGAFSDFLIHNIDECCWIKDAWPVEAIGSGGRHYRGEDIDQNFDTYSVEYTFEDGTKLFLNGRTIPGCHNEFASFVHGSKRCATISARGHSPAHCRIYNGQRFNRSEIAWRFDRGEPNPYQLEWNNLIAAIRNNTPYNEVPRGVMASLVTSMGRMACHTGQRITLEEFMEHDHEFAPGIDQLTPTSPSPLPASADGKYPVPMPGIVTNREYASA
ncbi:MAG: Gfo/Idh/MocA family oxidoreductase [Pirellulaceae bacterium]|nr:Gfo/Idh/MocA family oxidoreductase [Pirellulaceae bacterium]